MFGLEHSLKPYALEEPICPSFRIPFYQNPIFVVIVFNVFTFYLQINVDIKNGTHSFEDQSATGQLTNDGKSNPSSPAKNNWKLQCPSPG